MGVTTNIGWTDHTWSPWHGCAKVSPGCEHCYAEAGSKRNHAVLGKWGVHGTRVISKSWDKPLAWDRAARKAGVRRRVFPSLCDPFEDREELVEPRKRFLDLIAMTPSLDWLVLTKRPENVKRLWAWDVGEGTGDYFPENLWLGVSVEDQQRADERIPILLEIPAKVRFLSVEPLLGPIDLTQFLESRNEQYQTGGDPDLRSRPTRGAGDRQTRPNLEDRQTRMGSVEQNDTDKPMPPCEGGKVTSDRLSDGASHDRQGEGERTCSSTGMDALQREDPRGIDNQSYQWGQNRQQTGKSGTGDTFRADHPREGIAGQDETRRGMEQRRDVNRNASSGDTQAAFEWGETTTNSQGLRHCLSDGFQDSAKRTPGIWIICGGESGPAARPCDIAWIRSIVGQCKDADVACYVKQLGSAPIGSTIERSWTNVTSPVSHYQGVPLAHPKGGDWSEWPEDLRVRDVPAWD